MNTFKLKEPSTNTPEFTYQYPKNFSIKETLFQHIGYGLYMVSASGDKPLYLCDTDAYINMTFVALVSERELKELEGFEDFEEYNPDEERNLREILFAYSNRYTTWDREALYTYLTGHLEEFVLEEEQRKKCLEIVSIIKGKSYRVFGNSMDEWNRSREVEENNLDTPFLMEEDNGNYILLNGSVGTKIAEGIYQFMDPLKYRVDYEMNKYYGPVVEVSNDNAIDMDCTILYEKIPEMARFCITISGRVFYLLTGELTEQQREFIDLKGLDFKQYHAKKAEKEVSVDRKRVTYQEKNNSLQEEPQDLWEKFLSCGCREVFEGKGFFGRWTIKYNTIFEFCREPHKRYAELCGFNEKGVCILHKEDIIVLPYKLFRYLRISYVEYKEEESMDESAFKVDMDEKALQVGHTFIEKSDALEVELFGKDVVEFLKEKEWW